MSTKASSLDAFLSTAKVFLIHGPTVESIDKIFFEEKFYVHCKGGYRSMIASSILLAKGISNFSNIPGGYDKIKDYNS